MKIRLIAWEIGSFIWVVLAGSALHFSFELSEFWTPLAFISAVNESVWEHLKMYFWPGLIYALVQYTYTRDIANNYWYAKLASLIVTPLPRKLLASITFIVLGVVVMVTASVLTPPVRFTVVLEPVVAVTPARSILWL